MLLTCMLIVPTLQVLVFIHVDNCDIHYPKDKRGLGEGFTPG